MDYSELLFPIAAACVRPHFLTPQCTDRRYGVTFLLYRAAKNSAVDLHSHAE